MDFSVYAMRGVPEWADAVFASLKGGEGRFGWSYIETADLRKLKAKIDEGGWDSLSSDEKECYQEFLLELQPNDYVVYINVPTQGQCTVAKVTGPYFWRYEDDDFNHRFPVDPESVHVFDRNADIVHPALRRRLKLPGRKWQIHLKDEFAGLLEALEKGVTPAPATAGSNLRFLSKELRPLLRRITREIQHTHPNTDLEELITETFRNIPGVVDVKRRGGPADHGADILVTFEAGLPIEGLRHEAVMVVQVKSYEGEHYDTKAVDDIDRAFQHYQKNEKMNVSMGLIVSTADSVTDGVRQEAQKLQEKTGKPIALLVGPDVAKFILKYATHLET